MQSTYDKTPIIRVHGWDDAALEGYAAIANHLQQYSAQRSKTVIIIECYPGVRQEEIMSGLTPVLRPEKLVHVEDAAFDTATIQQMLARYLTDDRVFGYLAPYTIDEFYDQEHLQAMRNAIATTPAGVIIVIGFGASLVTEGDVLIYADLARWEIQQRYRSKECGNWRAGNEQEDTLRKYKRGYFVDWRVADRLKRSLFDRINYYLDTNRKDHPVMVSGAALQAGLAQAAKRPFRTVPYFDPGVWGGRWMQEVCGLESQANPYAWCFDGVPEENSLFFAYGSTRVELPAINLVFTHPIELLGEPVYARFGAEFPIRFDFLDTIGGQSLSLQVHPCTDYIRTTFGMPYTQDESYYILDAEPGAVVYLGLREGIDPESMLRDLELAQSGEISFPAEKYINIFPAHKHDHFLIPGGTIHCSGRGCMVLEISATPYIFTFKLWDWDRLGLDGKPRPVHLQHGRHNIRWDRTTEWVKHNLVNRVSPVSEHAGHIEEHTGLHELEFIETRRHWLSLPGEFETHASVNMLNLVEGAEVTVESPTGAFEPFVVHYAETFIVPASVGSYSIRPSGSSEGKQVGVIQAYVRS